MKKLLLLFALIFVLGRMHAQDEYYPYNIGYVGSGLKTDNGIGVGVSGGAVSATPFVNTSNGYFMTGFRGNMKLISPTFRKNMFVSKGYFASNVELKWEVANYADQITRFKIFRKKFEAKGDSVLVGTIAGTESSWKDEYAESGVLYKYTLFAEGITKAFKENYINILEGVGFRFPSGKVTGRITYKGGTAVKGVSVYAETDDKIGNGKSILLNGTSSYIAVSPEIDDTHFKFDSLFCFQAWYRPVQTQNACLLEKGAQYKISYTKGKINFTGAGTSVSVNFLEKKDTFFHVAALYTGDSIKLYVIYNDKTWWKASSKMVSKPVANDKDIFIGKSSSGEFFNGYVDECRIWQSKFSDTDILETFGQYISGSEEGLLAYYRLDEGVGKNNFDLSREGYDFNEHHGFIKDGKWATTTPLLSQLAFKGKTDENGNYTISGIPYGTNGSSYRITPVYDVHKFDPTEALLYFGESAVAHNNVNFTDASSFPVRGNVKYMHTNFPVAGVTLNVDGRTAVSNDGSPVMSDANGNFSVDVPIGKHYISLSMNGHGFQNKGRYPAPTPQDTLPLREFSESLSGLQFYDTTLIKVIGRVTGGPVQASKKMGLGKTVNNIGNAEIVFSTQKQMDLKDSEKDISGVWNNSMYKGADLANVGITNWKIQTITPKEIKITPDAETGEFIAYLLPEKYTVKSIKAGTYIFGEEYRTVLDLSNSYYWQTNLDSTFIGIKVNATGTKDSLYRTDSIRYQAQKEFIYRVMPTITVTSKNGSKVFWDTIASIDDISIPIVDSKGNMLTDYPVFSQRKTKYKLKIKVFERYVNSDKNNKEDNVPVTDGKIEIQNFLSTDESKQEYNINSKGELIYEFMGGLPNITTDASGGYTKTMSILAITGNNGSIKTAWPADGLFKAYLFGGMPTGNNFVTTGPTSIEMILRDPPGSNSYSYLEKSTSKTTSSSYAAKGKHEGSQKIKHQFGAEMTSWVGVGIGVVNTVEFNNNLSIGIEQEVNWSNENSVVKTTTTTQRWQTSESSDFVGAMGDIFIGNSTNIVYGKSTFISLVPVSDCKDGCVGKEVSGYKIGKSEGIRFSPKFGTAFIYSQNHIENYLIPNLKMIRNSFFDKGDGIYVSNLQYDDKDYGKPNTDTINFSTYLKDKKIIGDRYTVTIPAKWNPDSLFVDSVYFYNQQIREWENALKRNEKEKLNAKLKQNYSFDGGTVYEYSLTNDSTTSETNQRDFMITPVFAGELGFEVKGFGMTFEFEEKLGGGADISSSTENQTSVTYGYVLADENEGDYISVDVKTPSSQTGPVFITRGGQTSCPYEGAELTKYEQPGKIIGEATMQREKPQLEVETSLIADVPEDQYANFRLFVRNLSETNDDAWFSIGIDHTSNQNGANILIDGSPIGNERLVNVPAGQTIEKILSVEKTLDDVYEYENLVIILQSTCQSDIADSVSISAYFKPVCSAVALTNPGNPWLTNTQSDTTQLIGIDGYNLQHSSFNKILFQYKPSSSSQWITDNVFYVEKADYDAAQEPKTFINNEPSMNYKWDLSSLTDRKYDIRLKSVCIDNTENESKIHTGTKDIKPPKLFGTPQPGDGILSPNDDIMVNFDETIEAGILTPYNFKVRGVLNGFKKDHNICLYFDGIKSYANILKGVPLANKSFTIEFWLKRGAIGSQVIYSQSNALEIGFDASNKFYAKFGKTSITTQESYTDLSLWHHWSVVYNKESQNAEIYYDDQRLREQMPVADFSISDGRMIIGKSVSDDRFFNGYLHEFRIWEKALPFAQIYANLYAGFKGKEIGLSGYWPMDEAEGGKALDLARHRNAVLYNTIWRVFPGGKSREFNGTSDFVELNTGSTVVFLKNMDFTIEFWFKGGSQKNTVLFSGGKAELSNENEWLIGVNGGGEIYTMNKGTKLTATGENFLDNNWHHLALIMNRIGNLSLYIDANQKATGKGIDFGGMAGANMCLGARMYKNQGTQHDSYFSGKIDEFRIWKLSKEVKQIKLDKNSRLKGDEVGLCAYYPFEYYYFNSGIPEIRETLDDKIIQTNTGGTALATGGAFSEDAPNIKDARPIQDVSFDWTVNNDKIIITPKESNELIENTTLEITVSNVEDVNENRLASPVTWTAFINKNQVLWDATELFLTKNLYEPYSFEVEIMNLGGKQQNFSIQNLPSWMKASLTQGTLDPDSRLKITFTVDEAMNTGKYQESIFLHSDFGFDEKLLVNLNVVKAAPNWIVDKTKYQYTMNVVGQVSINNEISVDEDDLLAAFVGGQCRGVAKLAYYEDYDKYMAFIDIYSNNASGDSVTFQVWDASEGMIRSKVDPGYNFVPNDIKGNVTSPIIFKAQDFYSFPMALNKGWNWVSFCLASTKLMDANQLFLKKYRTSGDQIKGPVDSTGNILFDTYASNSWSKNFEQNGGLKPGYMYMVKTTNADTIPLDGTKINQQVPYISLNKGWNWLGYTRLAPTSLNDAFAFMSPQEGDLIKSRNAFALFSATTGWTGSLNYMKPGEGYMFKSSRSTRLVYPMSMQQKKAFIEIAKPKIKGYEVNESKYATNMSLVAKVILPSMIEADQEYMLAAFAGDECRGTALLINIPERNSNDYFLSIFGNGKEELRFELVNVNTNKKYFIKQTLVYSSDLITGTLNEPLILEASENELLKNKSTDIQFTVLPNPFNDHLSLTFISDEEGSLVIEFYNTQGLIIQVMNYSVAVGNNTINWEKAFCDQLASGVYYLKIRCNNQQEAKMIIKK